MFKYLVEHLKPVVEPTRVHESYLVVLKKKGNLHQLPVSVGQTDKKGNMSIIMVL